MGMSSKDAREAKVTAICKTIIEFALEYRTSRDKILQQRKRLIEKRERNKTRGKMWVDKEQLGGEEPQQQPAASQHHERHEAMSRVLAVDAGGFRRNRSRPSTHHQPAPLDNNQAKQLGQLLV